MRAIKVHELIERLQELDPNETVVLFLEEDRFDKEQPVYYVDDVWEAILFEHPELNRPYIKAIQDSGSLAIGVNGAKVVCALYPH